MDLSLHTTGINMAKTRINIIINEKTKELARKLSKDIFGRENISALIEFLIKKEEENGQNKRAK